jgi:hypothetical protein
MVLVGVGWCCVRWCYPVWLVAGLGGFDGKNTKKAKEEFPIDGLKVMIKVS